MHNLIAFTTRWGNHFGGINSFNYDLLCTLGNHHENHIRVICVVLTASNHDIEDAQKNNVKLLPLPNNHTNKSFTSQNVNNVISELKKQDLIDKSNDIVWLGHDRITGEIALQIRNQYKRGSTALIHHMSYAHYETFAENSKTSKEKSAAQKLIFEQSDIRLAIGPLLRDALLDLIGSDQQVTMLVPGMAKIPSNSIPKNFKVFLSGRLSGDIVPIKQSLLGVAAFSEFSKNANGIRPKLILRGFDFIKSESNSSSLPNNEEELKNFAQKYAEEAINLEVLPYTESRQELFNDLISSSVALMPSWHEGFGLVAWEAMAASVPVILTKQSGVYQLLSEEMIRTPWAVDIGGDVNPPYFSEKDVASITEKLTKIFNNQTVAKEQAKKIQSKLAKKYDWLSCVNDLIKSFGWEPKPTKLILSLISSDYLCPQQGFTQDFKKIPSLS